MALMKRGAVSDNVVKDDYPRDTEPTKDVAKNDTSMPKDAGAADKYNYGAKNGQNG